MVKLDECYQVLGIDPGATPEDVEEAYSELSRVWGTERFPNDDHVLRIAEKKMAEIDAAHDALLSFLGSTEKARPPGEIDPGASPLNRVCDNPRCTGVLDRNGICVVCGKRSAGDSFRYAVFCSACGTRNVIANQGDHDREVCAAVRRPLGAPVRLARKSSHKTAYFVLLAVILSLALLFFSIKKASGPGLEGASSRHPGSLPSNGTAVDKAQEAHALQRAEPKANRSSRHQPDRHRVIQPKALVRWPGRRSDQGMPPVKRWYQSRNRVGRLLKKIKRPNPSSRLG